VNDGTNEMTNMFSKKRAGNRNFYTPVVIRFSIAFVIFQS